MPESYDGACIITSYACIKMIIILATKTLGRYPLLRFMGGGDWKTLAADLLKAFTPADGFPNQNLSLVTAGS